MCLKLCGKETPNLKKHHEHFQGQGMFCSLLWLPNESGLNSQPGADITARSLPQSLDGHNKTMSPITQPQISHCTACSDTWMGSSLHETGADFFSSLIKGCIKNSFSPTNATRSQQHELAGRLEISCAPKRQHFQRFHLGHWGHITPYVPWQQNWGEGNWSWTSFWFILVVLPIFIGVCNLAVTLGALGCM